MRILHYILICLPLVMLTACRTADVETEENIAMAESLRSRLEQQLERGIMIGHQDDLAYGCMWYDEPGRSDMNFTCGHYPAVFGWDISNIETGNTLNPDSVQIAKIRQYIAQADSMGAVSTIRWSAAPVSQDCDCNLASILPGGPNNTAYNESLDKVAAFLHLLKDEDGEEIPVIFQPLFCPNEQSHWWYIDDDNEIETYKRAWAYTVNYLRDDGGVDNVLFAFTLASPQSIEEWSYYYPGDEYVDIMGVDVIAEPTDSIDSYRRNLCASLEAMTSFADDHHKLSAVTATGMMGVKTPNFFTRHMAEALRSHHLSYVVLWKNSWKDEDFYFVPIKGHPMADDFKNFVESDNILTCTDLYQSKHTEQHL